MDLGAAITDLLPQPPALLALGEPTHGVDAYPLLRNELLAQLVAEHGYRSIVLETDVFAASIVDEYGCGGDGDLDDVLARGFSHEFGKFPANRELVTWLRRHNETSADPVHFYGFDAPTETAAAPSPRTYLHAACAALGWSPEIDDLLGPDADWSNEAAMYDPAASIGDTAATRALRVIADDALTALHRTQPDNADALRNARTALGLLRYHAAMATPAPDRMATLLGMRDLMMAENLLAIERAERERGPVLVFANNSHLQLRESRWQGTWQGEALDWRWWSAGAHATRALGARYAFIATEPDPARDRTLVPATQAPADGAAAVIFLNDKTE